MGFLTKTHSEKVSLVDKISNSLTLKDQSELLGISRESLYYRKREIDPVTLKIMNRIEGLWRSVKYEEVYLKEYSSPRDAILSLRGYFEFYNYERLHQSLGDLTPAEVYFGKLGQVMPGKEVTKKTHNLANFVY